MRRVLVRGWGCICTGPSQVGLGGGRASMFCFPRHNFYPPVPARRYASAFHLPPPAWLHLTRAPPHRRRAGELARQQPRAGCHVQPFSAGLPAQAGVNERRQRRRRQHQPEAHDDVIVHRKGAVAQAAHGRGRVRRVSGASQRSRGRARSGSAGALLAPISAEVCAERNTRLKLGCFEISEG